MRRNNPEDETKYMKRKICLYSSDGSACSYCCTVYCHVYRLMATPHPLGHAPRLGHSLFRPRPPSTIFLIISFSSAGFLLQSLLVARGPLLAVMWPFQRRDSPPPPPHRSLLDKMAAKPLRAVRHLNSWKLTNLNSDRAETSRICLMLDFILT